MRSDGSGTRRPASSGWSRTCRPREGLLLGYWSWDALLFRDPATLAFQPLLATAWRQVDDRTLEFDIRQGVKFHNGDVLTPDDVVFTLNFVADPANHVFNQSVTSWIDHAEKSGPNSVRVRAKSVTPAAQEFIAQLPIYPEAYYKKVGRDGMNAHPVGTGPYTAEAGPNGTFVFTRFDGYFADSPKGKPPIRRFVYHAVPEMNTVIAQLVTGELDWAYYIRTTRPTTQAEAEAFSERADHERADLPDGDAEHGCCREGQRRHAAQGRAGAARHLDGEGSRRRSDPARAGLIEC